MSDKIKVGIVGATGYTGVELLRLLATHPNTKVTTVTSRSENGEIVSDHFPSLRGIYTLTFQSPEDARLEECDVVFFATPNGVAMKEVPDLLAKGVRIIDLSADFRIHDITIWEKWYGMTHACPHLVSQAVYGLCEMNKQDIAKAHLIANPGCYPTCVSLPLLPLLKQSCLKEDMPLIADCKSGVSGAGRKTSIGSLLCEAGDNFKFVPHLTPMIRGMQATIYLHLKEGTHPEEILRSYYKDNPFIDIMESGSMPETRSVRGANICRISIQRAPQNNNVWIILSVIDNLVKGAAGQAVQNMNIMFGFNESMGLTNTPLLP